MNGLALEAPLMRPFRLQTLRLDPVPSAQPHAKLRSEPSFGASCPACSCLATDSAISADKQLSRLVYPTRPYRPGMGYGSSFSSAAPRQ